MYLNGYVPQLQHGAGLVGFLCQQRGKPMASPALLGQITGKFVAQVKAFAKEQGIPLVDFERAEGVVAQGERSGTLGLVNMRPAQSGRG